MSDKQDIFTEAERKKVIATFARIFGASVRPGERFDVHGYHSEGRLEVALELADPDRREVATFYAGHETGGEDALNEIEARAHAVEFLHTAVHEYLQTNRFPRPHIDWREYTFDGRKVFLRGTVVDEFLESEADALLAAAERT